MCTVFPAPGTIFTTFNPVTIELDFLLSPCDCRENGGISDQPKSLSLLSGGEELPTPTV